MGAKVSTRRAYDEPGEDDGQRVLVDRIWPRGVKREALDIDDWAKEVAPSTELRRWYGHKVDRWDEFRRRYRAELKDGEAHEALQSLVERAQKGRLTLVYGARDGEHSQAEVLRELIEDRLKK